MYEKILVWKDRLAVTGEGSEVMKSEKRGYRLWVRGNG